MAPHLRLQLTFCLCRQKRVFFLLLRLWPLASAPHRPCVPGLPPATGEGSSRTSVTDAPPACDPAARVRREADGGIRQADGQDSLREADGVLQAHQGDVCAGALSPGVHGVGLNPGDTHFLGPRARVPQPPGPQQHRELGWVVQIAGRRGKETGSLRNPGRRVPRRVWGMTCSGRPLKQGL